MDPQTVFGQNISFNQVPIDTDIPSTNNDNQTTYTPHITQDQVIL